MNELQSEHTTFSFLKNLWQALLQKFLLSWVIVKMKMATLYDNSRCRIGIIARKYFKG